MVVAVGAATGMKRNKTFVIIVSAMSETENPTVHRVVKTFISISRFCMCRRGRWPILQRVPAVRVGVGVQYLLQGGGLPEERELRERMSGNNNLTVLNNFNGTYRELIINYRD